MLFFNLRPIGLVSNLTTAKEEIWRRGSTSMEGQIGNSGTFHDIRILILDRPVGFDLHALARLQFALYP